MEKTNKSIILCLLIIFIFCIGLSGWFYYSVIKGCFPWNCAPKREFDVTNVGIPESFYPRNVNIGELQEYDFKSIYTDANNASMGCRYPMDITYNINQYTQNTIAKDSFKSGKIENLTDIHEHKLLTIYVPKNATEYYYQCGEYYSFGYMCQFIAQYDEFVISYFTTTDAGVEQVDAVVQYLDERMGKLMRGEEVEDWREVKGPYWEEWEEAEK